MDKLIELNIRRNVCRNIIKTLDEMDKSEKQRDALMHYKKQLAIIDNKIAEITGKPPDIVIGLDAAVLSLKV